MTVHAIKPKPPQRPIQREALLRAQEEVTAEKFKLARLEDAVAKAVALVEQREADWRRHTHHRKGADCRR